MTELEKQGMAARKASRSLCVATSKEKNNALKEIAKALNENRDKWLSANKKDIENAKASGMKESLIDRLLLNDVRVDAIIASIQDIIDLEDPVGVVLEKFTRPNGLLIEKKSTPIGVIGIIYEARPNVTVDAVLLTLKSGNASILRGGKEAINSNLSVVEIIREALKKAGLPEDSVSLVKDTDRETATEMMNLTDYIDVLIPRGGKGLIRSVVKNATVPIIRTGEGVCHVFIDKDADLSMGAKILDNAKTSRPSVCNAAECVIVHKDVLEDFFKIAVPFLKQKNVALRCDDCSLPFAYGEKATEEDWDAEYGDYILAVKTVSDVNEAIDFINEHGTGHSECIVTENKETADIFLNSVDAAAVYHNASTRFTDGGEFGFGAEIGISTQKLHARGPMGLRELTSYKYVVTGKGQVR